MLAEIGAPAIEALIIASEDGRLKDEATAALVKLGTPAKEALIAATKSPDRKLRNAAHADLVRFGPTDHAWVIGELLTKGSGHSDA